MTDTTDKLAAAAAEYRARVARTSHPAGRFDRAGRFYLAVSEVCACCDVRSPSRSHPYSQMVHGRTLKHVAHLFGVEVADLRRATR